MDALRSFGTFLDLILTSGYCQLHKRRNLLTSYDPKWLRAVSAWELKSPNGWNFIYFGLIFQWFWENIIKKVYRSFAVKDTPRIGLIYKPVPV